MAGRWTASQNAGYVQYDEQEIPNYWAYARQFVLADNFFSSEYGPTCVEHFFNYAAQSDRFVDCARPGQFGLKQREFCDDPFEQAYSFPRFTKDERQQVSQLEIKARTGLTRSRPATGCGSRARTSACSRISFRRKGSAGRSTGGT